MWVNTTWRRATSLAAGCQQMAAQHSTPSIVLMRAGELGSRWAMEALGTKPESKLDTCMWQHSTLWAWRARKGGRPLCCQVPYQDVLNYYWLPAYCSTALLSL